MSFPRSGCAWPVLAVVAICFALVLVMPGALATYAVASALELRFDGAQVWTFAVPGSFAIYLGVLRASGGFLRGTGHFILISLIATMAVAVACFGLHARWPAAFVAMFVGATR